MALGGPTTMPRAEFLVDSLRAGRSVYPTRDVETVFRIARGAEQGVAFATELDSLFEKLVEKCLDIGSIGYLAQPQLPLSKSTSKKHHCKPDFVLDRVIEDRDGTRRVVLNPHGAFLFDEEFLHRCRKFMKRYGTTYHHVIVTNASRTIVNTVLEKAGLTEKDVAHEIWCVGSTDQTRHMLRGFPKDYDDKMIMEKLSDLKFRTRVGALA